MEEWRIKVKKINDMKILHIELSAPLRPEQLPTLGSSVVAVLAQEGVPPVLCISGRMPIWAHLAIAHEVQHLVPVISVFDPKLRSCVIVSSHRPEYAVGQQIPVPDELLRELLSPSPSSSQQR